MMTGQGCFTSSGSCGISGCVCRGLWGGRGGGCLDVETGIRFSGTGCPYIWVGYVGYVPAYW